MEKLPRMVNILDIKGRLPAQTLIHFSASQWQAITEGLPQTRARPKYGVGLEGYPIPGGDTLAQPMCIQNPCEICRIRVSGFTPEGMLTFDCQCRPDREHCPQDPPPPPPSPLCALTIQRTGRGLQLTCRSQGCSRNCHLAVARDQGRFLIFCQCR
jgi:hypothetical protein